MGKYARKIEKIAQKLSKPFKKEITKIFTEKEIKADKDTDWEEILFYLITDYMSDLENTEKQTILTNTQDVFTITLIELGKNNIFLLKNVKTGKETKIIISDTNSLYTPQNCKKVFDFLVKYYEKELSLKIKKLSEILFDYSTVKALLLGEIEYLFIALDVSKNILIAVHISESELKIIECENWKPKNGINIVESFKI